MPLSVAVPASDMDVLLVDEVSAEQLTPVDPNLPVRHHRVVPGAEGVALTLGDPVDPPGQVIYSNTGGTFNFAPGPNRWIADDLVGTAMGACDLGGYQVMVNGGGDGTGTDGFTVNLALFDSCPSGGGQMIAGTAATVTFEDDGLHLLTVDLSTAGIQVGPSMWIAARFSRAGAGWLVGTRAEVGFTADLYHYPTLPCVATMAGTDLYAGFYARVFCMGDFDTQYLAYLNNTALQNFSTGANRTVVDDIELMTSSCVMTGYEVGLRGSGGAYTAVIELWTDCNSDSAIPGTLRTFEGVGNGSIEVARFTFDEGVALPSSLLWMAITPSAAATGPQVAGLPEIGTTQDSYALWDEPGTPDACDFFWFGGDPYAGFFINVFCEGSPPTGACCTAPAQPGVQACRVVSQLGCEDGRWIEGAACDPDPFTPACGSSACCLPNSDCVDVSQEECINADGVWNRGRFCKLGPGVECPLFACIDGTGNCCEPQDLAAGCGSRSCCETVCEMDNWCCRVEWDQICADQARVLCSMTCSSGEITWLDPPNGVIDAGQPHALNDPEALQGIDAVMIEGPAGAGDACCWSLCETDFGNHTTNAIAGIEDHGDGVFTIHLDRPITPGAVTTLTYRGSDSTGTFMAHPGNVDGDVATAPADILALIDCLNGVPNTCLWGPYSCDTDRDGTCAPADILRVIDLLGGAATFDAWNGSNRPVTSDICP